MSPLGVGVIGLGVGEQHARAYALDSRATLRWVCDRDPSKVKRVIDALGNDVAAGGFDQILADPRTDLVSIATFDDQHFEQVVASLRAGKHVFCEKPLCHSVDEVRTIKRVLTEQRDRRLSCNLVLRAAPLYLQLREMIRGGELGRIFAFDGDYLYGRLSKITEGWRSTLTDYSVMQGGGVHLVDLMLWLTAERPDIVTAMGNRIASAGTAFRYDDYVCATYGFPSGLIGRISANFGCVHKHQHVIRIFGTERTFIYDDAGARLHAARDPGAPPIRLELPAVPPSKGELIPQFLEAVAAGRELGDETQHELDVITACVASDRALATAQSTRIEYV